MDSIIPSIRQGESFPFVFDLNGEDITDWICTIFVKQFPDSDAVIEREIDPENSTWPGYLVSSETLDLSTSAETPWYLIAKLVNSSTAQEIQIDRRFHVGQAWA